MQHQSRHITQQLLAPLNAAYQDVQKNLQMELDVERVSQNNGQDEQQTSAPSVSMKQTDMTTKSSATDLTAKTQLTDTKPLANIVTTARSASDQTLSITPVAESKASVPLNPPANNAIPSNNSAVVSSSPNQTLPIIPVAQAKTSITFNPVDSKVPTVSPQSNQTLPVTAVTETKTSATINPVTPANHPVTASLSINQVIPLTAVTEAKTPATINPAISANHPVTASLSTNQVIPLSPVENSKSTTGNAVQQVHINAANPIAPETEQHKTSALANEVKATDSVAKKIATETVKPQTTTINSPPVLIPLRNPPAENVTNTTGMQALPSVTANRLQTAVDPVLQQAYQLTQQQLQGATADSSEAAVTGLVRNTFNVSVAMNNQDSSDAVNLTAFEQALSDVLVKAARRQGLEV